uniref:SWIM-type domain-containing protein n=1 Tax=Lactuca sativa TaxID=4236 RepID=A0A9R1X3C2_LACSA|nr:hypothetical protein LSAT_V11C700372600 [Lactuca sativa]
MDLGILNAIATLFSCAKNRYCVHHIQDNMRKQWRGKPFEDLLWTCATATHVQQFNKGMEELKKLNKDCYEWLKKIPPQHRSRFHFTGRAHSDVILNNLCETFNGKLNEGRNKPIITCLEFIREYLMKKIRKGHWEMYWSFDTYSYADFGKYKKKAEDYRYVSGPWMDQCTVDVVQQTCSCRKWELTGMSCKHVVATIWEMRKNSKDSVCPTTLVPPKHRVTIGRPKKKRRKSAYEIDDMVKGNSASRILQSVTSLKCNNIGHNARSCKGKKASAPSGSGGSGKGKGKAGCRKGT